MKKFRNQHTVATTYNVILTRAVHEELKRRAGRIPVPMSRYVSHIVEQEMRRRMKRGKIMTLEELLRTTVPVPEGCVAPAGTPMSPDFIVSVQKITDAGVQIVVHPYGFSGETLDKEVVGDQLFDLSVSGSYL